MTGKVNLKQVERFFGLTPSMRVWSARPLIGCRKMLVVFVIEFRCEDDKAFCSSTEVATFRLIEVDLRDVDVCVDWKLVVRPCDNH